MRLGSGLVVGVVLAAILNWATCWLPVRDKDAPVLSATVAIEATSINIGQQTVSIAFAAFIAISLRNIGISSHQTAPLRLCAAFAATSSAWAQQPNKDTLDTFESYFDGLHETSAHLHKANPLPAFAMQAIVHLDVSAFSHTKGEGFEYDSLIAHEAVFRSTENNSNVSFIYVLCGPQSSATKARADMHAFSNAIQPTVSLSNLDMQHLLKTDVVLYLRYAYTYLFR
jgi:hypothetical protein